MKIKGKVTITSDKKEVFEIRGIYNNNHFSYKENDVLVTIDVNINKLVMKRSTNEYDMLLSLEKNKVTKNKYNIKNAFMYLTIKTYDIEIKDNKILIDYLICDSDTRFRYLLEYSLVEE